MVCDHRTEERSVSLIRQIKRSLQQTFARFFRHSVHAFGVTIPIPRRLLELAGASLDAIDDSSLLIRSL